MQGKKVALIWGAIIGGIGIWLFLKMDGALKYLLSPLLIFFGWHSLKAAVFMSDNEIDEISRTRGDPSTKTRKKFEDL